MDIKITKDEYMDYLSSYIERDTKLLNTHIILFKKSNNYDQVMYLEEIQKIADNLARNIHVKETTDIHKSGITFFIDSENGNPYRVYNVDDKGIFKKAQERVIKKQQDDVKEIKNTMFG